MQTSSVASLSPSFNSYSNSRLAGVAARVVAEFGSDEFYFEREENDSRSAEERETGDEEDDEFEFAFVKRDSDSTSPVSADDIFCNGQIRPVYPVFNRDLFLDKRNRFGDEGEKGNNNDDDDVVVPTVRLPLRKLFIEERETTATTATSDSSSSEADELEGVPAETYCVWRPKAAAAAEEEEKDGRCRKSNSTGSNSKRWRFKGLLHRSVSDGGKERFVFLSPSFSGRRKENEEKVKTAAAMAAPVASPPPYSRDGGGKRRSYLPYKQDLMGLFTSVNGLSKNLQPF